MEMYKISVFTYDEEEGKPPYKLIGSSKWLRLEEEEEYLRILEMFFEKNPEIVIGVERKKTKWKHTKNL